MTAAVNETSETHQDSLIRRIGRLIVRGHEKVPVCGQV